MKILRLLGKYVLALVGGIAGGLVLGGGCALLFTDMSISQFVSKLSDIVGLQLLTLLAEALVGLAVASIIAQN